MLKKNVINFVFFDFNLDLSCLYVSPLSRRQTLFFRFSEFSQNHVRVRMNHTKV